MSKTALEDLLAYFDYTEADRALLAELEGAPAKAHASVATPGFEVN